MNLNIVPIEYNKRGLEEIVRIIHHAFPDFFDKFIVRKHVDFLIYKDLMSYDADKKLIYFLNSNLINLLDDFEKPVIGITPYVAVRTPENINKSLGTFGAASTKGICFVSAHAPSLSNCEEAPRRMGIECIHELGHVYGLNHHEYCKEIPAKDSLCPMEIGHRTFRDKKKISLAHYFEARRTEFCDECREKLEKVDLENTFVF